MGYAQKNSSRLTPEAGVLEGGAGDSVRARAGRTDVPLVVAPGIAICLKLGEAMAGGLIDGLVGPTAGEWRGCVVGLRGR